MSELVADCPRCGAKRVTLDVIACAAQNTWFGWQVRYEAFAICRHCKRSTVFLVSEKGIDESKALEKRSLAAAGFSANDFVEVDGHVSQKDADPHPAPEHLPESIASAFEEGAKCLAVGCPNAAATMFRLCVDLATVGLLPTENTDGLNGRTRRSLGLRLAWLFDNKLLPESLRELSVCVKDDGDDGAHAGTLTKEDSEDLIEFAEALLERLYTEPERLRLAKERRDKRRSPKS